jgi:outer membrane protein assembly complex protein YaeT
VENAIGITRVRIEPYLIAPESKPETRLTVGQDITSDLTGIYSVNLADTGDQIWVAEYDLTRRFRTRGIKQADNTYRLDFNHRLRFPRGSGSRRSALDRRTVGTIQFEGDHSFSESTLNDKFKLRSGQRYDFFKAQKGLDKVRGLFDDQDLLEARVRLRRSESEGAVDLRVKIESGPVVTLQFKGDEVSSSTQDRVRQLWSQGVSDTQRRRESVREIRRSLFEKGFLTGQVDCRISIADGGKQVTFEVTKGSEISQTKLFFEGSEAFESGWLETQLKEADLLLALFLDPAEATNFLHGLYRRKGFLNARVQAPVIRFDEAASEARVTLSIEEGPVYKIGAIAFSGNRVFGDEELQEAVGVTTEDIYYPGLLGEMVVRLEDFYLSKGYNRSEITEMAQPAQDNRIDLVFQIEENIQDIVEEIEISGNDRVGAGFIQRQIGIEVGEVLDLEIISRARKRLYDIGAFSLVEIETVEIERAQDTKGTQRPMRLAVKVRETVPHRLDYGAFFDTDRGPGANVDYRNHNLLRNGRVLGLSGRYDGDRREFRGYFSQPARYWFPLRTYASTVVAREFRPSFEFSEFGFSIEQQAEIRDTLIGSYGFSFVRNRIRERDPDVELEDVPLNVGALNTSLAWDTRDSFLEPTGGHFLSSSFRFAPAQFGSDLPFIKYFGGYSRYFPLAKPSGDLFGGGRGRPRLIFATWVRVGLAKGFDQDTISPTERFFAGGGTTIRGFKQDTVGPLNDNGVAVGGNSLFIWNNEIRFPVFRFLDGVGFLDVGNVYATLSDFDPTDLRKAAGIGLRIRTPFVLIRFDYGFKLDRQPGESRGAFFFSIGQAF